MKRRSYMSAEPDISQPREPLRVKSAAYEKFLRRQPLRHPQEQLVQRFLSILGIGPQVRKVGSIFLHRLDRIVHGGIDAAVERGDSLCPQARLEFVQRRTARIAEHQVEVMQTARTDIAD